MKKTLALASLIALSLSVSACKSSNNDNNQPEPTPAPNPTPNPKEDPKPTPTPEPPAPNNGDNNNTIKPDESPINAAVVIKAPKDLVVTIQSDKPLTVTGATLVDATKHTYKVSTNAGFGLDGTPEDLIISAATATEFTLDKDMPSLKSLKVSTNSSLTRVSLNGAKSLERLEIVGAKVTHALDLSSFSKLRMLVLGNRPANVGNFTQDLRAEYNAINTANQSTDTYFGSVSLPSSLEVLLLARAYPALTGTDNLPNLKAAYLYSTDLTKLGNIAFATSTQLDRLFVAYNTGVTRLSSLTLRNKPQLRYFGLYRCNIDRLVADGIRSDINIFGAQAYDVPTVEIHNTGANQIYQLLVAANGATSVDLTNNPALTSDHLVRLAERRNSEGTAYVLFNKAGGDLKVEAAKATDAVKAAFSARGWTVNK